MSFVALLGLLGLLGSACSSPRSAQSSASSAAAEPAPAPDIDCAALASCPDAPCADGEGCYHLEACGAARCVPSTQVCARVCGSDACAIAESFPMQVMCKQDGAASAGTPAPAPADDPCAEAEAALQRELEKVSRCASADQCGQVVQGSSCGCTRNAIARLDADLAEYEARNARLQELGCGGMASVCDCPAADGYVCNDAHCGWNYQ